MRVLMVNKFRWRKGGSETYCLGLAEALERAGHEVAWFAMEDPRNEPGPWDAYFAPNADYSGGGSALAKARAAATLVYNPEAKRRFGRLCRDFRPDAVHLNLVHRQLTLSILDAPYLAENKTPVVWTAHDYIGVCPGYLMLDGDGKVCEACLDGRFRHCVERRCVKGSRAKSALAAAEAAFLRATRAYSKIDRIIAPSEFMRAMLLKGGFPASQVVTMRNFAGSNSMERARAGRDSTNREHPYLLFFGRLSKEKGIDVLVDAFLSVAGRAPGWKLIIAGEGPERQALEKHLSGHPEGRRVELVGFLQGETLMRYAEGASFAVASSGWREVLSYSNMEALAAGTPVICTDMGGMTELVADAETGFLCEPGDAESLASAILRGIALFEDPVAYRAMQAQCRARVLNLCDPERYLESLVSLYLEIGREKKEAH